MGEKMWEKIKEKKQKRENRVKLRKRKKTVFKERGIKIE